MTTVLRLRMLLKFRSMKKHITPGYHTYCGKLYFKCYEVKDLHQSLPQEHPEKITRTLTNSPVPARHQIWAQVDTQELWIIRKVTGSKKNRKVLVVPYLAGDDVEGKQVTFNRFAEYMRILDD